MTRIHAGAVLERTPGRKYVEALDFAELSIVGPLPKASTLKRWGESTPSELTLSLVVPRAATRSARGPLRFDDEMRAALDWSLEAASALGARFAVLPTGGDVTTGQRDRDLLAQWVEAWTGDARLVWHPAGLWDPELARPFARKLGVVCAFDPLETAPPRDAELVYARLQAMGLRKRFGETELLEVLDAFTELEGSEIYVSIESGKSFDEARRLAQLAAELE